MKGGRTTTHPRYYECLRCTKRITRRSYRPVCPACGGRLRNIAAPLE